MSPCADRPRICLRETLSADLRATLADERVEPRLTTIGAYLAFRPGIQAVALFRISQWLLSRKLAPLAYSVALCATYLTGSELAPTAVIGPGLTVNHPAGVVIHGHTIAGRNLRLHTGVVLGERSGNGRHGAPVLGDDVLIGAGAKVLGPIRIGDRVRIGANAVVIEDVPVDHHAVGVPAQILSRYGHPPRSDDANTR
jgi:serine O-acetyltransferase